MPRYKLTAYGLLLVAALQGCHHCGWYHYDTCHVYLGVPPGGKTYGHPWHASYWYRGWPTYSGPIDVVSANYPISTAGIETQPIAPFESAPMPRLQPDAQAPDVLIPPPRPLKPMEKSEKGPLPPAPVSPSLQLRLTGPQQVSLSQSFICNLVVQNGTQAPLEDVEVIMHLPKAVRFVASQPPAQLRANEAVWTFAHFSPGQVEAITISLQAQHTANQAVCYATAVGRDGTGAASSLAVRIVPEGR